MVYPVDGSFINLRPLGTDNGTIPTCNTTLSHYFSLAIHNPDGFYRALPDTGITNPAKILDRINKPPLFNLLFRHHKTSLFTYRV
jgi:hypothetical protein